MHFPSMISLVSPDFACGGRRTANGTNEDDAKLGSFLVNDDADAGALTSDTDKAFRNMSIDHRLGISPDFLSLATIRAYASHNLRSSLAY